MKIIGLIGGLGPESTIDYYQRLIAAHKALVGDGSYPRIIINSVDLTKMIGLVSDKRYDELASELASEVERLVAAGADFGALTANTAHVVFDEVARRTSLPLISIVDSARDAAVASGIRKALLLGTRFTMSGNFYSSVFAKTDVELIVPAAADQEVIHDKYMNELLVGTFSDETRALFVALLERARKEQQIDAVILAGTELPLLLRDERIEGVRLLDTTDIHVNAIARAATSS